MQSLEYCVLYQQKTCLRFLTLYFKYKTHVPVNKGTCLSSVFSVFTLIDFFVSLQMQQNITFSSPWKPSMIWEVIIRVDDRLICRKGQLDSAAGFFLEPVILLFLKTKLEDD